MRLAFLTHEPFYPPSGGGSAEAVYLVEEMVARGWEVHLFCPRVTPLNRVARCFGRSGHLTALFHFFLSDPDATFGAPNRRSVNFITRFFVVELLLCSRPDTLFPAITTGELQGFVVRLG